MTGQRGGRGGTGADALCQEVLADIQKGVFDMWKSCMQCPGFMLHPHLAHETQSSYATRPWLPLEGLKLEMRWGEVTLQPPIPTPCPLSPYNVEWYSELWHPTDSSCSSSGNSDHFLFLCMCLGGLVGRLRLCLLLPAYIHFYFDCVSLRLTVTHCSFSKREEIKG